MKHLFLFVVYGCLVFNANAQDSLPELLKRYNTNNIPYISVQELAMPKTQAIILDTREKVEFKTSHIKNAMFVGFNNFEIDTVLKKIPDKTSKIVVYCSIGIRSETIASKLKKAGYNNVYNLYGGIFEWKNNHFAVYNSQEKKTDSIHAFSEPWSKWLKQGIKVF